MEETIVISKGLLSELIDNYWNASGTCSDIYDRCNGYEKELDEEMDEIEKTDKWVKETFGKLDKQEYI